MSGTDSAAQSAASGLLIQYQAKLTEVSTGAVVIQLVLMFCFSIGTVLAFSFLRPKNKIVYMPRYKYSAGNKRPPKLSDGLFDWLKPLISISEDELVTKIGMDAVIFLRLLRMCRWMCGLMAGLAMAILLPCDLVYNLKNSPTTTFAGSTNKLAMVTISQVRGSYLYVHVAYAYIATFVAIYIIYINYKAVLRLRWQWFRSHEYQNALYARSLMMTHVGPKHMSDPGLQTLLTQLQIPYPTTAVHIGRRVGNLPTLIEKHNQTVRDLEQVLATYLKNGKISPKRPIAHIGSNFLGLGGKRVDAIDYYTAKIKALELRIQSAREAIMDRKPENYGFASFAAVSYAHIVAKKLGSKRIKGVAFSLAPAPHDIIWENLTKSDAVVFRQRVIGEALLTAIATVYIIPLVALALLANLASLSQYVAFLANWSNASPLTFAAVAGILPPLLSTLLQLALPMIMRALTKFQAATTHHKLDRAVLSRYFSFLAVTQFLIFSLLGVVFSTVAEVVVEIGKKESFFKILRNLNKLPDKIQATYIQQSNYWLTWFPLRGFTAVLDLIQIVSLVWIIIRTKVWGRTPREIREWTKPPEFDYSVYTANMLLMLLVAFVYAPLAPLVPLLASVSFFASSWVYKYQLMYISVTRCESGGRLWRMIINRVLFALCAMHAFLWLTIGLQLGWMKSITTLPPLAVIIAFKFFLKSTFDAQFTWYIPKGTELTKAQEHHTDARKNRLLKRFGHPSLHAELFTPMIHKDHQSLLPEVYSGRIADLEDTLPDVPSNAALLSQKPAYEYAMSPPVKKGQPYAGGLKFAAIAQHDLMYSKQQYLRERDEDEMSMTTVMTSTESPDATLHHPMPLMHRNSSDFDVQSRTSNIAPGYRRNPSAQAWNSPSRSGTPTRGYESSQDHSGAAQPLRTTPHESFEMSRVGTLENFSSDRLNRGGMGQTFQPNSQTRYQSTERSPYRPPYPPRPNPPY
ncbi:hypothetical protein PPACK8108_LOCUS7443 [Phakopsora pachyrhizi]|uniref:DUF221-domain-containing protein n=1 Tax=Phakopsora pachyrhizi TaxID=170000 RepID=A0AAV0ASZ1_PHAPC|nr:hypothetical protein PPACK8108_LOCUS7443 [Phakopsora pachyrhizi]